MASTIQGIALGVQGFVRFNRGVLAMPLGWQGWEVALVAANIVAPLFFLEHVEARATIAAGVFGLVAMSYLTARFGFTRILGLGHIAWIPLLAYLGSRLAGVPPTDVFGIWLRLVVVLDAASLVFDGLDVFRFARGERIETVPTGLAPQE